MLQELSEQCGGYFEKTSEKQKNSEVKMARKKSMGQTKNLNRNDRFSLGKSGNDQNK